MLLLKVECIARLLFIISDIIVYFFGGPDDFGVRNNLRIVIIENYFAYFDALFAEFENILFFEGITLNVY